MNLAHHPADDLLLEYAAGVLPQAPGLAVRAHLRRCQACRRTAALLMEVGGALLDEAPPAFEAKPRPSLASARPSGPDRRASPPAAAEPVRWWGPGRRIQKIAGSADGWRAYLLEAPSGARLPPHRHGGREFTCILAGALEDHAGRYETGDFMCGEGDPHRVRVVGGVPCRAVMAIQGRLQLTGLLAPFSVP